LDDKYLVVISSKKRDRFELCMCSKERALSQTGERETLTGASDRCFGTRKEEHLTYDEKALAALTEKSQDLQADSLHTTKLALTEFVEVSRESESRGDTADPSVTELAGERGAPHQRTLSPGMVGALVAGGFGAGIAALFNASAAAAASTSNKTDVMIMQTAASIEVLAVATYAKALTLPFIGGSGANGVVKAFATTTKSQHAEHLAAFNAAAVQLGGKKQNAADPKYAPIVAKAVPTLKTPLDVVKLAKTLEMVAAQTYVNDCAVLQSQAARKVTASIMGVEAQHVAVLDAVAALLEAGAPQLISLAAGTAAALPPVAGKVGIPYTFYPTTLASPAAEGAVK
jgi:hypothetical protein